MKLFRWWMDTISTVLLAVTAIVCMSIGQPQTGGVFVCAMLLCRIATTLDGKP